MKKIIENQTNGLEAKYHKNVVETNAKNKKKKLFEESFKPGNKKNAKKSRTITTIVKMPNITQIKSRKKTQANVTKSNALFDGIVDINLFAVV